MWDLIQKKLEMRHSMSNVIVLVTEERREIRFSSMSSYEWVFLKVTSGNTQYLIK